MNFSEFSSPILLQGNADTAYRDPCVVYRNGRFYLFFTLVETEPDGTVFLYLGMTTSHDLRNFTPVVKLTERDRARNFSSPGCIIPFNGRFVLCLQTYCRENGEKYGNENCRLWIMRSDDLVHWEPPELLRVKGPEIPREKMGRMIDPYLVRDKDNPDTIWCFFKQNGVSRSRSRDLINWEFCGSLPAGENVCVLTAGDRYLMWHSPPNGIGFMTSRDLVNWEDRGILTLGQAGWPWAQGRLTAGYVLDLRTEPEVGKALMFFHGTGPQDERVIFDTHACIGFAWSDDLEHWTYLE